MKSTTEQKAFLRSENENRTRAGRRPQILRLSVTLAMTVATVASAQSYRVLKTFTGIDGGHPFGGLVLADNTLYGTTYDGGTSNFGVVFKMNTDGSGYTVLKNFTGGEGQNPYAGLALASSTLYGTTVNGGTSNLGVVFKVNTDGSGYTVLKNFTGSDGQNPYAGLALAGFTLYGTTHGGGGGQEGVVFKVNTDGSAYTVLKSFANGEWHPLGGLVLGGSTLYGTTYGPLMPRGTVYKLNNDGTGFSVLKWFTNLVDGVGPRAGVVLSGSTLYGTTYAGGGGQEGVVFKVNTDGSGYAVLKNLTGSDGGYPYGGLVLADSTLYGTTRFGRSSNCGVVFSGLCLSITRPPLTQTAEAGTTFVFTVQAASFAPGLTYQWFFNETNALGGATNAFLELPNVQPDQAGAYTIVVTNLAEGAVTSAPALLSVIPPVEKRVIRALHLTGATGSLLHVEYADSLGVPQWFSVANVTLSGGPQYCFDASQPLPAQRFYRAWQTNGPQPALAATVATEIPLAGPVGSSVRVDYINQFGPTEAWVTLDTVTMTNTMQLYYDVTAFGRPARLYRLVALP